MLLESREILGKRTIAGGWRVMVATPLLIGLLAAASYAQPPGQADYLKYCAGCHGTNGKGNGPDVYTLGGPPPPSLTDIAKRNGGVFPSQQVADTIDGTKSLPGHTRFDMPFWGVELLEPGQTLSTDSRARVEARINQIVSYVQSIQQR